MVQRPREIIDLMDRYTTQILKDRKLAIEKEDQTALEQLDMGRDILSMICECSSVHV